MSGTETDTPNGAEPTVPTSEVDSEQIDPKNATLEENTASMEPEVSSSAVQVPSIADGAEKEAIQDDSQSLVPVRTKRKHQNEGTCTSMAFLSADFLAREQ